VRRDVDEEVGLHVELRTQQLLERGLDAATARREAERMFARSEGAVDALYGVARERSRHMSLQYRWEAWRQDVRHAARGMLRDRLTSAFIVLVLTAGIGANVTSLTLLDRLLLRDPAHVADPDGLVRLYRTQTTELTGAETSAWIPHAAYRRLTESLSTLERTGAYRITEQTVGRGISAQRLRVAETLGDFFGTFGTTAVRGRVFSADEDRATAGALAVVSEDWWRDQLGGDAGVLGQSVAVGDDTYTIVGVAPHGFTGAEMRRVDIWLLGDVQGARAVNWKVAGRLAAGATPEAVGEEVALVHARASADIPQWFREARMSVAPVRFDDSGREPFEATMARWLTAISLVILVVAFGNVINLLLARSARRRRELAIRAALGSGRARLLRLVALEGVLLSLAAGLLSLLVVRVLEPFIRQALLTGDAPWTFSLLDVRVLTVLLTVVLLSSLILGLVSAALTRTTRLTTFLRGDDQGGLRGARLRSALTVLQAAMSVVLLVGAGLFIRSLDRVRDLDLGVDRDRVLVARAELLAGFGASSDRELMVLQRAAEAVQALPGVERAAVAVGLPLDGGTFSAPLHIPGRDSIPSLSDGAFASAVGVGYFETIGTAVLHGRGFDERDVAGAEPVLVVNETMARRVWPGMAALDQCVRVGSATAPCSRVVGVAVDVHRVGLTEAASLQFYMPLGQQTMFSGASLLIRPTARAPSSLAELRRSIAAADPAIRMVELQPLSAALDGEVRPLHLGMIAFGLSGGLALLVAVLGLYSVMAFMVAWRTHEIGVRMALGATRAQIMTLIIGGGGRLAVIGVAVGIVAALLGGRWLEPHLFRTSAADPLVLGGVAAGLLAVALLAGWAPALRAVRTSPTDALRS
jgi:predicted permease